MMKAKNAKAKCALVFMFGLTASIATAQTAQPESMQPEAPVQEQIQEQTDIQPFNNRPPPAPMTVVEAIEEEGFTYMCGGVGAEESQKMKQAAKDYDMMLTFATRRGGYLADVNVDIQNAKGESMLQTICDGPIMLVDFPKSGAYRIHAETGGYALNKLVQVKAKGTQGKSKGRSSPQVVLTWPQQVAEAMETAPSSPVSTGSSK